MPQLQPLDQHQQELINILRVAHENLIVARKTRENEVRRRVALEKARLKKEYETALDETEARVRVQLDAEVAIHASRQDDALVACYNSGLPIRRMALEGFGNQYDGGVHGLLRELREDGRIGNREGYQRNTTDELDTDARTVFPQPVDVNDILSTATTVSGPVFSLNPEQLVLVPGDALGNDEVTAWSVILELDPRDPWFKSIAANARPGTPFLRATTCTLYLHPATGELMTKESKESGDVLWDHPVARWVKNHPEEARAGFNAALAAGVTNSADS